MNILVFSKEAFNTFGLKISEKSMKTLKSTDVSSTSTSTTTVLGLDSNNNDKAYPSTPLKLCTAPVKYRA